MSKIVEKNQTRAIQLALLTVFLWSTVATAFKLALNSATPIQVVVVSSLSSLFVLAVLYMRQTNSVPLFTIFKRHPIKYLLSGFINPFFYYFVLFAAYDKLPAQIAQPINYTWAIVLALLAAPILGQKFTKGDGIGLLFCYSGVVVLVTKLDFSQLSSFDLSGVLLAILSTVIWASYWLINTKSDADPITAIFLGFICATPWLIGLGIYNWGSFQFNQTNVFASIYIGLFEMSLAFVLWLQAMKLATSTAQITSLIYISPFLSLIFINLILDEPIYATTLVGLVIISIGLYLQKTINKKLELTKLKASQAHG